MRHKTRRLIGPGLVLLLVTTVPAAGEVPARIKSPKATQSAPMWVSVDEAIANGQVRWELFDQFQQMLLRPALESARRTTERAQKAPSTAGADQTGCVQWSMTNRGPSLGDYSLKTLYHDAGLVFTGMVTDERQGFYNGQGATLYEIAVDRVLKQPLAVPGLRRVYLVHSYATIRVGEDLICERDLRYPARPAPGRPILVLTSTIIGDNPVLIDAADDGLIYELADGKLSLPARFGVIIDPPTWESIVEDIITVAGEASQIQPPAREERQKP